MPQAGKTSLLLSLLEDTALSRVIVFTRTKHGANKLAGVLEQKGVQVNAIHGNKSQPQREKALREFRTGRARVLVATDIAARGIDVTGVSHVINFDLPVEAESYVHRIGRTARAGADGIAIAFCDPYGAGRAAPDRAYVGEPRSPSSATLRRRWTVRSSSRSARAHPARPSAAVSATGQRAATTGAITAPPRRVATACSNTPQVAIP